VKTKSFCWWALVILCASSALDFPLFLLGFGPLVGLPRLWFGWETPLRFDPEEINLINHLEAFEYLGALLGFYLAQEIAFRDENRRRLFVASLLTFPVGFMGFLGMMEIVNLIYVLSTVLLFVVGVRGLFRIAWLPAPTPRSN
jgi:hypothetical protein